MVSGHSLRCLLGSAGSASQLLAAGQCAYFKNLMMIRTLFPQDLILQMCACSSLDHFLQNSLAIVKELLVLNIIQDKPVNELFCISKTNRSGPP